MLDNYNREIDYLRISLTNRCNLQCFYCVGAEPFLSVAQAEISIEQTIQIAKSATMIGIKKIRLTGGEPLLRNDIVEIVQELSKLKGIQHIGLTTNGILLKEKALSLKKAGLSSVNISLDTLDPLKYRSMTKNGDIDNVFNGIKEALCCDIPIKINTVVIENFNETEIPKIKEYCLKNSLKSQLIKQYNLGSQKPLAHKFDRPPKCKNCNKLRILSNSKIKPCLFSDNEVDIDYQDVRRSLIKAIRQKPENGISCQNRKIIEIGG